VWLPAAAARLPAGGAQKMTLHLGILHPGEMGSFLAATAMATLGTVYWCSAGRSAATRARAAALGLSEIDSLEAFCRHCTHLVSVCPPHAAREQAEAVIAAGFRGVYVDANAIAPASMQELTSLLQDAGLQVVDGGIIGVPTQQRGQTWLYLSGVEAEAVAQCFRAGPLETGILGPESGQASALKMCFAAWNKGRNALLTAVLAAAEGLQVRAALQQQLDSYDAGFAAASEQRLRSIARKTWRFGPEMEEIEATLQTQGLPQGFFTAAAELYRRQSAFKDSPAPALTEILEAVRRSAD
jgi:3-hydroxyisobutyrate dehydrogenase-like beta-hydroxyacid dehydrogenase